MELAIKTPKLDRMVSSEETMKIQEVISAIVIVSVPASVIALVPDVGELGQCLRMLLVDVCHQMLVHLLAEPHSFGFYFKSLIKKVVFASDDIDEVPNGPYVVVSAIKVDVDTATGVCECSTFP